METERTESSHLGSQSSRQGEHIGNCGNLSKPPSLPPSDTPSTKATPPKSLQRATTNWRRNIHMPETYGGYLIQTTTVPFLGDKGRLREKGVFLAYSSRL